MPLLVDEGFGLPVLGCASAWRSSLSGSSKANKPSCVRWPNIRGAVMKNRFSRRWWGVRAGSWWSFRRARATLGHSWCANYAGSECPPIFARILWWSGRFFQSFLRSSRSFQLSNPFHAADAAWDRHAVVPLWKQLPFAPEERRSVLQKNVQPLREVLGGHGVRQWCGFSHRWEGSSLMRGSLRRVLPVESPRQGPRHAALPSSSY